MPDEAEALAVEWSRNGSVEVPVLGKLGDVWDLVAGVPTKLKHGMFTQLASLGIDDWKKAISTYGTSTSTGQPEGSVLVSLGHAMGVGIAQAINVVQPSPVAPSRQQQTGGELPWATNLEATRMAIKNDLNRNANGTFSLDRGIRKRMWEDFNKGVFLPFHNALCNPHGDKYARAKNTILSVAPTSGTVHKARLLQSAILGLDSPAIVYKEPTCDSTQNSDSDFSVD